VVEYDAALRACLFQLCQAWRGDEEVRLHAFQPQRAVDGLGALAHEHQVWAVLEDLPRQTYRAARPHHAGDAPGPALAAFHDRGVEFRQPLAVEHGADPGVEQRAVLELHHDLFHHVQGRRAGAQQRSAVLGDGLQVGLVLGLRAGVRRQVAGAAVEGKSDHGLVGVVGPTLSVFAQCLNGARAAGACLRRL
jgi:hypothetical protein